MNAPTVRAIAAQLNRKAAAHPIGNPQEIRAELHHQRRAGRDIFRSATTRSSWAFHFGGRRELQFNIGLENGGRELRHGVAFSIQRNINLRDPARVLGPKVRLFNEFMRRRSKLYKDMCMWHYFIKEEKRSRNYTPAPIQDELVTEEVFIFLGKLQRIERINYEVILDDFDRLLELYKFTEGGGESQTASLSIDVDVSRPGSDKTALSTIARAARKQWKVTFHHNRKLRKALYRQLVSKFPNREVFEELPTLGGKSVDVVVKQRDGYWFYEIKTADSARACLREALGQLIEYAFWPSGTRVVSRLIVVGEAVMDSDCEKYLHLLQKCFSLPSSING
jgi:hypothetical protein